jgi:hypothetical protein
MNSIKIWSSRFILKNNQENRMNVNRLHVEKLVIVFLLTGITLACSISLGDGGEAEAPQPDLVGTQAALQITQTAAAAAQAAQPEAPQAPAPNVSFNGVSFFTGLAQSVDTQRVPAEVAAETFWSTPEYDRIELVGYPTGNEYHQPVVQVYSVEAFRSVNENSAGRISDLQALLASLTLPASGALPFLPVFNAAQMVQVKPVFLDFQNGSGVRFITQFGQASWPVYNQGMIYTFQGLTADGNYYISVIMPLSHPELAQYDNFEPDNTFYDNVDQFMKDQVSMLNSQPDDSFTPSLTDLDAMVKSLKVEK